ncbi:aldehyde ferredoxin oxidoreductase family protein [Perlabentimonas gracilis]|uniref:aldehyde ferredoxin oxidoreductase family protein n=1 Tax=Perlabentimonas gracilis TaxID=2715279 RepID=UPI00140D0334|nr:aldehyde ferredoxin oxidoreductase family protein [Perlabentimonas gracilis]NHB67472.1 aldehyde ferredoxin oxidoreductase family protein [Perlabentimonas gracilis]
MYGYRGKILRVNLSDLTFRFEDLNLNEAVKFIGGRGLGSKIFFDEVDPNIDAFDPNNKVIIAAGPMTGTPTPAGGRYMVVTKSPLTGTIASSNSGGFWGAEMKFAGYDAIVLEGKAAKPTSIYIVDDKVEFRDASNLWGKTTIETTNEVMKNAPDKAKVLCIGPAGENLSKMAAVMNDLNRAAGRSGVGAVVGSKNLKAIVIKGTSKPEVADPEALKEVVKKSRVQIKENGVTGAGLPTYGTNVLVNIINEAGVFPTNNFQESYFDKAEEVSGETLAEKFLIKRESCFACPIACGRYSKADEIETGGPEYETVWAFSAACGVSDMKAAIKANFWCNEMGLDTISAGVTIATAMELYQIGLIKDDELNGVGLKFGDADGMVEWVKKMGRNDGKLATLMAQGSYRLADAYGRPELSMSVKKQELPAYDPRGIQGQGLQYATSNRGGCHVRGYLISPEILGLPEKLDRTELKGKPEWVKIFQDLTAFIDSCGLCLFTSFALTADDYADMFSAVTGKKHSAADILEAGDRIWNLERVWNLKAGIDPSEDKLPKRLIEDAIPSGPSKGMKSGLAELLPLYYQVRGWDEKGIPTKDKLDSLGVPS